MTSLRCDVSLRCYVVPLLMPSDVSLRCHVALISCRAMSLCAHVKSWDMYKGGEVTPLLMSSHGEVWSLLPHTKSRKGVASPHSYILSSA